MSKNSKSAARRFREDERSTESVKPDAKKSSRSSAPNKDVWVDDLHSDVLLAVRSALASNDRKSSPAQSIPQFDMDFAATNDSEHSNTRDEVTPPVDQNRAKVDAVDRSAATNAGVASAVNQRGTEFPGTPAPSDADSDLLEALDLDTYALEPEAAISGAPVQTEEFEPSPALVRDLDQILAVPAHTTAGHPSNIARAGAPRQSVISRAARGLKSLRFNGLPTTKSRNTVEAVGLIAVSTFAVSAVFFHLMPDQERATREPIPLASKRSDNAVQPASVPSSNQSQIDVIAAPLTEPIPGRANINETQENDASSDKVSVPGSTVAATASNDASAGDVGRETTTEVPLEPRLKTTAPEEAAVSKAVARLTVATGEVEPASNPTVATEPVKIPEPSRVTDKQAAARVVLNSAMEFDPFFTSKAASVEVVEEAKILYAKAARMGGTRFPELLAVLKAGNKNAITAVAPQFLSQARSRLTQGKVLEARTLLELVDGADRSEVALAMARSFDPSYLSSLNNVDAKASAKDAERWYRRWFDLSVKSGQVSADVNIERLIRGMN